MKLASFLTLLEEMPHAQMTSSEWGSLLPAAFSSALYETEAFSSTYTPFPARPDIVWRVVVHQESDAVAIDDRTGSTVNVDLESLRLFELDLAIFRRVLASCLEVFPSTDVIEARAQYFYVGNVHRRGSGNVNVTLVLGGPSAESRVAMVQQRVLCCKPGDVVLLPTTRNVSTQLREWAASRSCQLSTLDQLLVESDDRLKPLPSCSALLEGYAPTDEHSPRLTKRRRVRSNVNALLKKAIDEVKAEIRRRIKHVQSSTYQGVEANLPRYTNKTLASRLSIADYTVSRLCRSTGGEPLKRLLDLVNDPDRLRTASDRKSCNQDCT